MSDTLFVPHWEVPEPRGDLRAPLFRENGTAIEDQSAPAPGGGAPHAADDARLPPDTTRSDAGDGRPAGDPAPNAPREAGAALIAPAGPRADPEDSGPDREPDRTPGGTSENDAPLVSGPRVVKGEPPESTGTRSVVIACAIGFVIAAAIVWAALLLRPANAGPAPHGPEAAAGMASAA